MTEYMKDWREAVEPCRAYYALPGNSVGGSLHIVLDDGNIEDLHVDFCIQWAQEQGDKAGEDLARLIRTMSPTQRRKLYSHYGEYVHD